jgi:small multidrug resistance family-3 protein
MGGRSIALFCIAALVEIGDAYLVWVGLRAGKDPAAIVAGIVALAIYGLLASQQPSSEFGRVLAAYGGVFVHGGEVVRAVVELHGCNGGP